MNSFLKLFFLASFFCINSSLWAQVQVYSYNSTLGKCLDAHGREGLNPISKEYLLSTGDGECGEFSNAGVLHPEDIPKGSAGWDFRGADLSSLYISGGSYCGVTFHRAKMQGAQMEDMNWIYACIEGEIDSHTQIIIDTSDSEFGCRLVGPNQLMCIR